MKHENGSSNRTFMELKLWTCINENGTSQGSNRTFMELKFHMGKEQCGSKTVLIVPLWN